MKHIAIWGMLSMLVLGISGCGRSVEIIAHRGASHLAPENTLAAFNLAWEKHADAETDVYLTKDQQVVCIHDKTTKRTGGEDLAVSQTDSSRLRELDVGSFKSPQFAGEQIPLLSEVLATIPREQKLFVEIKCGQEVLPELQRTLVESGKMDRIVIIGFDLETVTAAKKLIGLPTYWLKGTDKVKDTEQWIPHDPQLIQMAKERGLDGLDVHYAGVTQEFVHAAKASGQKLYVWTVDDPQEAARLVALGVTGITTNRPEWLRDQLQGRATAGK